MTHSVASNGRALQRGVQGMLAALVPVLVPVLVPIFGALPSVSHAATGAAKPVLQTQRATATYVTRPGDSLYGIAARYLLDPGDWTVLRRMNLVREPRRLRPGITLRLPVALLQRDHLAARVVATSGRVERAFRKGPLMPLNVGATLSEGDRIRTSEGAFVTLEFDDGSHVSVSQNSSIDLGTLRKTALTGTTERVINLRQGKVDSEVMHAPKPGDQFQIRSPSVAAGVRGTRFRVNYLRDSKATTVEVLDGTVGVDALAARQSALQLIPARFGSVTHGEARAGEPVALLAAPTLVDPARLQDAQDVVFDLVPLAAASTYRVQIGRDAGMLDVMCELHVAQPRAALDELADGTYFVRVSGTDDQGLEGLSQVYAFERRHLGLAASAVPEPGSHDYQFRWLMSQTGVETRFRFVLASTPDLHNPIFDKTDLAGRQIVVTDLPRGVYYWTVIAERFDNGRFDETGSAVQSFTLAY
ncbi:FecR domain-containing protein [Pararobbsia alpina]|uniref:LysM domain-containing protein n=1 Tax=Pararobbsia alpina TaxID=621374 RepID=A0A6S7BGH1_9BURK|nr:FecR domain-containing protein [Pararobbsia alpina]CAB3799543.1 hypothetical protein LMG28138_04671 [Pararobbsia alpina]